jgi:hypothetical protein
MSSTLPSDFFLGLVFYFHDYDPCLLESKLVPQTIYEPIAPSSPLLTAPSLEPQQQQEPSASPDSILSIIRAHSGMLLASFDPTKATHYICPYVDNSTPSDSITLATLYWLHDVIVCKDKHLPLSQSPLYTPRKRDDLHPAGLDGQLWSISGFHHQRSRLLAMLLQSGAIVTDYLTEKHSGLVCER